MLSEEEVRQKLYIVEHTPINKLPLYGVIIKHDISGYREALRCVLEIDENEIM